MPKFEPTLLAKPSTTGFCVFFGGGGFKLFCWNVGQCAHGPSRTLGFCGSTFLTRFRCGSGYTSMELESETVIFETAGLR